MKKKEILMLAVISLVFLSSIAFSSKFIIRRAFKIEFPSYVEAKPGDSLLIEGNVTNIGTVWLRKITINVTGLPFNYSIYPGYMEVLPIRWKWSPENGLERVPRSLNIVVNIPKNVSEGNYTVTIKLQEHLTALKVYNYTTFTLSVKNPHSIKSSKKLVNKQPKIKITSLSLPDEVITNKPFLLNLTLENKGGKGNASVSVILPHDWVVDNSTKEIIMGQNSTALVVFNITPGRENGNVTLVIMYDGQRDVITFYRSGKYLLPVESVKETSHSSFSWIIIASLALLIAIFAVFFKVVKINIQRKKPEEITSK